MKKLNAKQEMFCREYLIDLNASQAAIRAGYSEKTAKEIGHENLTKPHIAEFIHELKRERAESVKIDAAWVLSQAVKLHQRCMQAEKVTLPNGDPMLDPDGNPVYKFEHSGAAKSLEIIGKHISVKAFEGGTESQQGESLSISFNVNEAVKDIRVTRGQ